MYFNNNILSDDVYGSRHTQKLDQRRNGIRHHQRQPFLRRMEPVLPGSLRTIHTALDNQDRMNINEQVKSRLIAELRLLRAYTYLRLTTWFGDVPLFTTNPTLPESKTISRTSADQIKQFIHAELEEVSHILPKNTELTEAENGRVTCGTA